MTIQCFALKYFTSTSILLGQGMINIFSTEKNLKTYGLTQNLFSVI